MDVEKVRQRCVNGFTLNGLTMATHAFDFMVFFNKYCWMSREAIDNTSSTHTSLLPNFLGWQKTTLITSKMFGEDFFCIKLQPILSVHHTHIMHDTMSKEYAL